MHTAWGVFKAAGMTGEQRDDFYRLWYGAADALDAEAFAGSWKAALVPPSGRFSQMRGGNLVLTSRRVLFEPLLNARVAFGAHGAKTVMNSLAALSDRLAPPVQVVLGLGEIAGVEARDGHRASIVLTTRGGTAWEFWPSPVWNPLRRDDVEGRDAAVAAIGSALLLPTLAR